MKKKQVQIFRLEDRVLFDAAMAGQIDAMNTATEQQAEAQAEESENGGAEEKEAENNNFADAEVNSDAAANAETLTVTADDADDTEADTTVDTVNFAEAPLTSTATLTAEAQDADDSNDSTVTMDLLEDSATVTVDALPSFATSSDPLEADAEEGGDQKTRNLTEYDCRGKLIIVENGVTDAETLASKFALTEDDQILVLDDSEDTGKDFLTQIDEFVKDQTTVTTETILTDNEAVFDTIEVTPFVYDETSSDSFEKQLNDYINANQAAADTKITNLKNELNTTYPSGDYNLVINDDTDVIKTTEHKTVEHTYTPAGQSTPVTDKYEYDVVTKVTVNSRLQHEETITKVRQYDSMHFFTNASEEGYMLIDGQKYTSDNVTEDDAKWVSVTGHLGKSYDFKRTVSGNTVTETYTYKDGVTATRTVTYQLWGNETATAETASVTHASDMAFYGSDLAKNANGKALLAAIQDVRSSSLGVAASEDATGLTGNWTLEYQLGTIDDSTYLTVHAQGYDTPVRIDEISQTQADALINERFSVWDVKLGTDGNVTGGGE